MEEKALPGIKNSKYLVLDLTLYLKFDILK